MNSELKDENKPRSRRKESKKIKKEKQQERLTYEEYLKYKELSEKINGKPFGKRHRKPTIKPVEEAVEEETIEETIDDTKQTSQPEYLDDDFFDEDFEYVDPDDYEQPEEDVEEFIDDEQQFDDEPYDDMLDEYEEEEKLGLSKNQKIIIGVGIVCVVAAAGFLIYEQSKHDNTSETNNKPTNEEPTPESTIGITINPDVVAPTVEDSPIVKSLINMGYSEDAAHKMEANFSADDISAILNSYYRSEIENYTREANFNFDYLDDYEDARTKYNLTPGETVDYVNRAYEIFYCDFYEDATINQIVEVIMAIDNKDIFTKDNANLAQSFNTVFNEITNNYLFGEITDDNIYKLDALPYFAKEDSQMYYFLNRFSGLAKNILIDNDDASREQMRNFVTIFATTLNGFINDSSVLTNSEDFNEDAILPDYYDWYIAYNSFIAPLYPIYSKTEAEFEKMYELQEVMISALQGPEFEAICGQGKVLGGNK